MTVHNKAVKNEIHKVVLMPGDPLRAKWMAQTFLKDFRLVNDIRNMYAYSGIYNNHPITIMGHGMGIASIGIYSYELFHFYDVDLIIRVGSCGSYQKDINVGDLLLVKSCYSSSNYANEIGITSFNHTLSANLALNKEVITIANKHHIAIKEVNAFSSDVFYGQIKSVAEIKKLTNADVVEMESFALFANAIKLHKNALCFLTCSDSLVKAEAMDAHARQTKFINMAKLALEFSSYYLQKKPN